MVQIEVDYITPLLMGSQQTTPINYWDTVEVLLDSIPQQYSYDNATMTSTLHLAFLEKEFSQVQTDDFSGQYWRNPSPNTQIQVWTFKQKPSRMVVRPEVLQNKLWNIRLKFTHQAEPSNVMTTYAAGGMSKEIDSVNDYKIVLSCTK